MRALRLRLLIQHLSSLLVLLVAGGITLFVVMRWSGHRHLQTSVRKEIEKLASQCELEPDFPEVYSDRIDDLRLDGDVLWWQVLAPDGRVLGSSTNLRGRLIPGAGEPNLPVGQWRIDYGRWEQWGSLYMGRLRVEKRRSAKPGRAITMPETYVFDVRAAVSATSLEAQLRRLMWGLFLGIPLLLAMSSVALLGLIRRAVHPVELALERERRFTGVASHELRTPLTALHGELEIALRRPRTDEDYRHALDRMRPIVDTMVRVVDRLLTLARAEAGNLLLGSGKLPLAEFLDDVSLTLDALPERARVHIHHSEIPHVLFAGDKVLLSQAVRNLVENALIHGEGSPVQLSVVADRNEFVVAIRDAGPGFPEPLLAAVSQGPAFTTWRRGGASRFGLALTQAVVGAHGGCLRLTNLNPGAQAEIHIPLSGR